MSRLCSVSIAGISDDKIKEIKMMHRSQKRKVVQLEGNNDHYFDSNFINADRKILTILRYVRT